MGEGLRLLPLFSVPEQFGDVGGVCYDVFKKPPKKDRK